MIDKQGGENAFDAEVLDERDNDGVPAAIHDEVQEPTSL